MKEKRKEPMKKEKSRYEDEKQDMRLLKKKVKKSALK